MAALKEVRTNGDDIASEYVDPDHIQLTALAKGVEERTKAMCADPALWPWLSPFVGKDAEGKLVWIPWAPLDSVPVEQYDNDHWMRCQLSWAKYEPKMPNLTMLMELHSILCAQSICPPHDPLFTQAIVDKGGKDKYVGNNLHHDQPYAGTPVITLMSTKSYHIKMSVGKSKETLQEGETYAVAMDKFFDKPHGYRIDHDQGTVVRVASHFTNEDQVRALIAQFKRNADNGLEHSAITLHERNFDAEEADEYKEADEYTQMLMDIARYEIKTPPNKHINPKEKNNKAAWAQTISERGKVGVIDRHQKKRKMSAMYSVKALKSVESKRHKKAKKDIENKEESDD